MRERADMFFLKCVSFTVGFMNEWSVASVPWFLEEMKLQSVHTCCSSPCGVRLCVPLEGM